MLSDRAIRSSIERFRLAPPTAADPCLDVLLDASLSMTAGDGSKEELARELAILLLELSGSAGMRGTLCAVRGRDRNRMIDAAESGRIVHVPFDSEGPMFESLDRDAFGRAGAMRVVISDFLWPGDPTPLVRAVADGAARLWLVQVLDDWESNPEPGGRTILRDVETDEVVEVVLDEAAIDAYRVRLTHLRETLDQACRSVGGSLVGTSASVGLESLCAERLVPAGLLCVREPLAVQPSISPAPQIQ